MTELEIDAFLNIVKYGSITKAAEILYKNRFMNVLIITAKHLTWVYGDYRINECKKFLMEKSVKVTVVEYSVSNVTIHIARQVA